MGVRRWLARRHIDRRAAELAALVVAAVALEVAAGTGLAYVAGFGAVYTALRRVSWPWLCLVLAALGVSFAGYYLAYVGIYCAEGYELSRRKLRAVALAGFGGFFTHGGTTPDDLVLQSSGAGRRDAMIRVGVLGGMEQGVLALGGCAASIAVLALGLAAPPASFTLPWAVVPVPASAVAFWAAGRFRETLRPRGGWLGKLGVFLDSVAVIRAMFHHPAWHWRALAGMALFWVADALAIWLALAAFGLRMEGAALAVGLCTGMVFTRRIAPLAGSGILTLILPVTIWLSGAPLATAVAGIFAYRLLCLWLPMPPAIATLPVLREVSKRAAPGAGRGGPPATLPDDRGDGMTAGPPAPEPAGRRAGGPPPQSTS